MTDKTSFPDELTPDHCQQRLRDQRDLFNEAHSTRLHRAISWWRAAQAHSDDSDLRFITAWIGLSACCVTSARNDQTVPNFLPLVQRLTEFDSNKRYYQLLWQQYSGPVKELIKNPYVFAPYWEAQRAADSKDNQWRPAFEQSSVAALNCLSRQRVPELVAIVFDRLYVLQNQLIQGGATYQGRVNRSQVSHGAAMAEALLAVTIDIMLEHADEHWGDLIYPVSDSY